jgi:hypothetical protein
MNSVLKRKLLEKQITGALKCAIIAHGPIVKNNLSSATKRIAGNILCSKDIEITEEQFKQNIVYFLDYYHSKLISNRKILNRCKNSENSLYLRSKNKVLGLILNDLRKMVFKNKIPPEIENYLRFEDERKSQGIPDEKLNS